MQTNRHPGMQAVKVIEAYRQTDRGRKSHRQAGKQTYRQTCKQVGMLAGRHNQAGNQAVIGNGTWITRAIILLTVHGRI